MTAFHTFLKNNPFCIKVYSFLRWHERFDSFIKKIRGYQLKKSGYILFDKKSSTKFFLPNYQKDFIQKFIFEKKSFFEKSYLDLITKKWRNGIIQKTITSKCVLDIGCNIGNHTLYFLNVCNSPKVYCFEPLKSTFSILEKNIELNDLRERAVLMNVGIGAHNAQGSISFYDENNIGSTSIKEDSSGNISIISIDELNIQDSIGLIKIDVEGFELEVIKGALATIKKYKPFIMIELRHRYKKEIENTLCSIGYQYSIINEDPKFNDCLFYPDKQ
jgi:FkbM family methyltransferase